MPGYDFKRTVTSAAGGAAWGGIPGALIAGGADILGGLIGSSGQTSANETNLAIARENREFQREMSNTAYQRSAKDLEKAGLNRILALGSPSSSPGGNIATMQNPKAHLARGVSAAAHSAASLAKNAAEISNINATTKATEASTILTGQRSLIASHGAAIASIGGDLARTTRILLGNKSPKQYAAIIQNQINKAIPIVTNILETTGQTAKQIHQAILDIRNSFEIMIMDAINPQIPSSIEGIGARGWTHDVPRMDK